MGKRIVVAIWVIVLGGALIWAYTPSFQAPFYLDSTRHVTEAFHRHLDRLDMESLNQAMRVSYNGRIDRPVSALSLAVNWYFSQDDPFWYRLCNVFFHLGAALAAFFMLQSLWKVKRVRAAAPFIADNALIASLVAASLWALHPIQTNAVSYVVQRMAILEGLFAFLCVGAYVRARLSEGRARYLWFAFCVGSALLAYGSKESAVTLLPLLGAVEIFMFSGLSWEKLKRPLLLLALCSLAFVLVNGDFIAASWQYLVGIRDFTPWERFMTQWRLQYWYLFLLVFPDPRILQLDASVALSRGLLDPPTTLLALAGIVGVLLFSIRISRRHPLAALGVWWFFLAQLVESTIFPLELYFEHRMYVPSVFVFLGVSCLLLRAVRAARPILRTLVFATVFLGLAAATHSRNIIWGNPVLFVEDNIRKAPDKKRPYAHAARLYSDLAVGIEDEEERAKVAEAVEALMLKAFDLSDEKRKAANHFNIAMIYRKLGEKELMREHLQAILDNGNEGNWITYRELAYATLEGGGGGEAAARLIEKSLELNPYDVYSVALGDAVRILEEDTLASVSPKDEKRFDPGYIEAWKDLGAAYAKAGDIGKARLCYLKAARLAPGSSSVQRGLQIIERMSAETITDGQ